MFCHRGVRVNQGGSCPRIAAAHGHRVRALLRPKADIRGLEGLDFERVDGDITDPAACALAAKGCEWCFHVAASYHLWLRDYRPMYAANIDGTRNVLQAAASAGCARIVYTSTVGCIGWRANKLSGGDRRFQ